MNSPNDYPNRFLVTRTQEVADAYIDALCEDKNFKTAKSKKDDQNDPYVLRAENAAKNIRVYVVLTDENPRNIYNMYDLVSREKTGAIIWADSSILGVMRLSTFHNFPIVILSTPEDGLAFFRSGIPGDTMKELMMNLSQRRTSLIQGAAEQRPRITHEKKPPRQKKEFVQETAEKKKPAKKNSAASSHKQVKKDTSPVRVPVPYAPGSFANKKWNNMGDDI
jgi:hypothetical protein